MDLLVNIATSKHKCIVVGASSSQNETLHPPSSVISENKDSVWISGEGLPQQIIISLEHVQFAYQFITTIIFTLAHDYETNPKEIQIWTAKNMDWADEGQYVHWQTLNLKKKRGKQSFSISQIPQSERIIKIKITQTHGMFNTYLNKVMLMAEPDPQTSQSLFNIQQWNKLAAESAPKQKKNKALFTDLHKNSGLSKALNQLSPLQMLKDIDELDQSGSQIKQKKLQVQDIQQHSYQRNAAMLAISKNMIVMEDNIEELNRKVQVLEKKIQYTYQNFQAGIMKKVEKLVEQKLQRHFSRKSLIDDQPRRLKSCKDLTTSRTLNHYGSSKQKQKKVMNLVAQLNGKLKQRSKLATKLQKRIQGSTNLKIKPKSQYYD